MNVGEMEHMIERMPVILVSLRTESDRGCVLVVSTMVEHLLEQHILRRLLPKASSSGDELMSMSVLASLRRANAPSFINFASLETHAHTRLSSSISRPTTSKTASRTSLISHNRSGNPCAMRLHDSQG
jgi:hypothetical protein